MSSRIAICLLFLFVAAPARAQRYVTHTYGLREGLPTAEVSGMIQDEDGRMWFATRAGMVVYDGLNWQVDTPNALIGGDAFFMCRRDAQGRIWAATTSRLFVHAEGEWSELPVFAIRGKPSVQGPIALILVESSGQTTPVIIFESGRILRLVGDQWKTEQLLIDEEPQSIHSVVSRGEGIYIATDLGVLEIDMEARLVARLGDHVGDDSPRALALDERSENLWVVYPGRVGVIDLAAKVPTPVQFLPPGFDLTRFFARSPAMAAAADGRGGLYLGNFQFLAHFDRENGLEFLRRESGLIAEGVNSLYLDREQNMWISTPRGLTKIISRRLASFDAENKLYDDEVSAILELSDRSILLGHSGGVLTRINGSEREFIVVKEDEANARIMDLAEASDGTIWAACEYLGLARISADHRTVELFKPGATAAVNAVVLDGDRPPIIGTDQGAFRFADGAFTRLSLPPHDEQQPAIRRMIRGPSGTVYAATMSSGVFTISGDEIHRYNQPPELRNTYTVLEARDGRVWVGARLGLCLLGDESLESSKEPLIQRPVYGLVEDREGRIWAGTDNGVYRWNGTSIDHLNTENGLIGLEVNRAAAIMDRRGRVWIGTDRGVSKFLPGEEARISTGPTVKLLRLEAGGIDYPLDREVELDHDTRNLTFYFAGISFIDENRIRFRTFLEGFDPDWSEPRLAPLREIRFANLPAGRYRLRIQPIDAEGRMGPIVDSPFIEVARPFWLATWFMIAMGLLVAMLGAGVFSFLTERRHGRLLEAQVRARTEELKKAAEAQARITRLDSLGILAGGIAHDFNNLLTAIGGYTALIADDPSLGDENRAMITQMDKACRKAEGLARQLLTFARGGAPVREVAAIGSILADAVDFSLRGSGVKARFELPKTLPNLHVDVGQIHQVISNIVINARQAMKESGTLVVRARLEEADRNGGAQMVMFEFEDSGPGIDPSILSQVFDPYFSTKTDGTGLGLAIAHSIVHKHGGMLSAESPQGRGAIFRMSLPTSSLELAPTSRPPETRRRFSGRILVMEDQATVREFARRALERLGLEVVACASGQEAVGAYAEARSAGSCFDAVLMDLTVPGGISGSEAARIILAEHPEARIIVTTGYSNEATLAEFESHGFRARLPKPYVLDDLSRVLAEVLG